MCIKYISSSLSIEEYIPKMLRLVVNCDRNTHSKDHRKLSCVVAYWSVAYMAYIFLAFTMVKFGTVYLSL